MNLFAQLTATLLTALLVSTSSVAAETRVSLPRTGLVPDELAVIVNDDDSLSQQVGSYYQKTRGIPAANMIHLKFKPGLSMPAQQANLIKIQEFTLYLDSRIPNTRMSRLFTI